MRKTFRRNSVCITAFLLLVCAGGAQAALVNFTLSGTVDSTPGPYPFGLSYGSTITASGVFDDAAISSSSHTVYFDQVHSGNTLSISAGTLLLTQTDDDFYLAGGPRLEFNSAGNLIGLNFSSLSFTSGTLGFLVGDLDLATGAWNANTFSMTPAAPVPVPAAVWLLGSGLMSLAGVARRRKNVA